MAKDTEPHAKIVLELTLSEIETLEAALRSGASDVTVIQEHRRTGNIILRVAETLRRTASAIRPKPKPPTIIS